MRTTQYWKEFLAAAKSVGGLTNAAVIDALEKAKAEKVEGHKRIRSDAGHVSKMLSLRYDTKPRIVEVRHIIAELTDLQKARVLADLNGWVLRERVQAIPLTARKMARLLADIGTLLVELQSPDAPDNRAHLLREAARLASLLESFALAATTDDDCDGDGEPLDVIAA